jgi:hypothetical protein
MASDSVLTALSNDLNFTARGVAPPIEPGCDERRAAPAGQLYMGPNGKLKAPGSRNGFRSRLREGSRAFLIREKFGEPASAQFQRQLSEVL